MIDPAKVQVISLIGKGRNCRQMESRRVGGGEEMSRTQADRMRGFWFLGIVALVKPLLFCCVWCVGSYGEVFKGEYNRSLVAIKRFALRNEISEMIAKEVEVLRSVSVPICDSPGCFERSAHTILHHSLGCQGPAPPGEVCCETV